MQHPVWRGGNPIERGFGQVEVDRRNLAPAGRAWKDLLQFAKGPIFAHIRLMSDGDWQRKFRAVYDLGVAAWSKGNRTPQTMFDSEDTAFLESIGCTAQELFDFVDDAQGWGEPDFDSVLAVQGIRRDYFLDEMEGKWTGHVASMEDLPPKRQAVDGIEWLPRIIQKARIKLRGEMPEDLMYGCGGDRPFLDEMNMTLAEFLKLVWDSGDDDRRIIDAVKRSANRAGV